MRLPRQLNELLQRGLEAIPTLPKSAQRHQLELKLHIAIAMPLASAGGYVAPELQHTLERAQVLCNELGNPPELFPVLHGLGKFYQAQADHDQVEALGVALLDMAQSTGDTALLIEAHRSLGLCYSMTGEYDKCIAHNEKVLERYTTEEHSSHVHLYAVDPSVVANSFIARALWAVGRIDEGAECAEKSISHAIEIGHPYSETFALSSASTLYQLRDDPAKVAGYAGKAVELATRHSFPFWLGWSAVPLGWAMCRLGKQTEGLATIEKGLAGYQQAGVDAGLPMRLATKASALELEGQFDESQKLLERALQLPATARDMYRGELHRLLASCLMHTAPDKVADIEHHLQQSIHWCEQHNAQTLLLRCLLTQLKFSADSKQQQRLLDAVGELYSKFDQGLDTPDLLAAKEVLENKPAGIA
jgi:tetratricopeptide (TPR) repeat protein